MSDNVYKVVQLVGSAPGSIEAAVDNVPRIDGPVYVCPDVSGSMGWPVTGFRGSASSAGMAEQFNAINGPWDRGLP